MSEIPVKSLIQFRSVSKAWKSLIDSSEFIAAHSLRRSICLYRMVIRLTMMTLSPNRDLPLFIKQLSHYILSDSSHGLLFLYEPGLKFEPGMAVLWNPSINVPGPGDGELSVGFGLVTLRLWRLHNLGINQILKPVTDVKLWFTL